MCSIRHHALKRMGEREYGLLHRFLTNEMEAQGPSQWVLGFFPGGKSSRSAKLTIHVHLAQRLRMSGAILLRPYMPSRSGQGRFCLLPLPRCRRVLNFTLYPRGLSTRHPNSRWPVEPWSQYGRSIEKNRTWFPVRPVCSLVIALTKTSWIMWRQTPTKTSLQRGRRKKGGGLQ
jgi:hypothetical protein